MHCFSIPHKTDLKDYQIRKISKFRTSPLSVSEGFVKAVGCAPKLPGMFAGSVKSWWLHFDGSGEFPGSGEGEEME